MSSRPRPFANDDDDDLDAPFDGVFSADDDGDMDDMKFSAEPTKVREAAPDDSEDYDDNEDFDASESDGGNDFSGIIALPAPANQIAFEPDEFPQVKAGETHIVIWGTTQSGKTTFLAALYRLFTDPKERKKYRNLLMSADNQIATRWGRLIFLPLFNYGVFPPGTAVTDLSYPVFSISQDNGQTALLRLTFINGPGELFKDPEAFVKKYNLRGNPIDYMRDCHALLMLVDPSLAVRGDPTGELEALVSHLERIRLDKNGNALSVKLKKPVAFCLTKCDEPQHRSAMNDLEGFLERYFGRLMKDLTDAICETSKWYPSSALGFEEDKPAITFQRWNGTQGIRKEEFLRPINVGEPLLWLLEQLGVIPPQP